MATNSIMILQLLQMIKNSGNPQQFVMNMVSTQANQNPVFANLLQLMKSNDSKGIEQVVRNIAASQGVDFDKDLRAYDSLAKLSNLTPKNVKEANEFDSFGEVFAYLEKAGWMNKYYDGAVRDEVDNTEKNIKNWLRYLYVNESGVAEEIEERINNLKVAAELEDEEFDENEFRQYMDEQNIEQEDFKIEL